MVNQESMRRHSMDSTTSRSSINSDSFSTIDQLTPLQAKIKQILNHPITILYLFIVAIGITFTPLIVFAISPNTGFRLSGAYIPVLFILFLSCVVEFIFRLIINGRTYPGSLIWLDLIVIMLFYPSFTIYMQDLTLAIPVNLALFNPGAISYFIPLTHSRWVGNLLSSVLRLGKLSRYVQLALSVYYNIYSFELVFNDETQTTPTLSKRALKTLDSASPQTVNPDLSSRESSKDSSSGSFATDASSLSEVAGGERASLVEDEHTSHY